MCPYKGVAIADPRDLLTGGHARSLSYRMPYRPCRHAGLNVLSSKLPRRQLKPDGLCVQVHIRHAGKSSMMLNTASLPGTAQRALKLAEREHQLSNQHPTTSREVTKSPTVTSG